MKIGAKIVAFCIYACSLGLVASRPAQSLKDKISEALQNSVNINKQLEELERLHGPLIKSIEGYNQRLAQIDRQKAEKQEIFSDLIGGADSEPMVENMTNLLRADIEQSLKKLDDERKKISQEKITMLRKYQYTNPKTGKTISLFGLKVSKDYEDLTRELKQSAEKIHRLFELREVEARNFLASTKDKKGRLPSITEGEENES